MYSVVLDVGNVKFKLFFTTLNINERRLQNSYELTFSNDRLTRPIMIKYIVLGVYDEVGVLKLFNCL